MCLLSFFPPGVQPTPKYLREGTYVNRDGSGWAIVSDGTILTGRGMKGWLVVDEFVEARKKHPGGPALFHSRFGTSGTKDVHNCHPFHVGADPLTVLAHNGVLRAMPKDAKDCDTRQFAQVDMHQFRKLDKPAVRTALEARIGTANKIVILTANSRYHEQFYIFNEQAGHWHNGKHGKEWHSNWDFLPYDELEAAGWPKRRRRYATTGNAYRGSSYSYNGSGSFGSFGGFGGTTTEVPPRRCDLCLERGGVDENTGVCLMCGWCNDCLLPEADCLCWAPGKNWQTRELAVPTQEQIIRSLEEGQ